VGADQHLVVAFEERAQRLDLAAVVVARRVAQVPLGLDLPVGPEAVLRQRLVVEAGPMDFSGTTMMACLMPWFLSLSSATNISARLLPDAGGDLMSRYCSPRFS
jgi:hypothetical protein